MTSRSDCTHRGTIEQVAVSFNAAAGFLALYWCPRCGALGERDERLGKKKPGAVRWRAPSATRAPAGEQKT